MCFLRAPYTTPLVMAGSWRRGACLASHACPEAAKGEQSSWAICLPKCVLPPLLLSPHILVLTDFYFMCVLPVCVYACMHACMYTCTQYLCCSEEDVGFLGTGVTDGC